MGAIGDLLDPADEPDLIAVVTNEGDEGYVLRDELNGPMPANPEEALAMSRDVQTRLIPVFRSDGVTTIGAFSVGPDPAQ